jgi:hypothetical protein
MFRLLPLKQRDLTLPDSSVVNVRRPSVPEWTWGFHVHWLVFSALGAVGVRGVQVAWPDSVEDLICRSPDICARLVSGWRSDGLVDLTLDEIKSDARPRIRR